GELDRCEAAEVRLPHSVWSRASGSRFWAAGAVSHMQFDWYRVYDVGSLRMPQVTVAIKHFNLPEMPFFGLGDQTTLRNRSLFKLTETELPILVDFPVAWGLTLSAQATTLYATSDPSRTFIS